MRISRRSFLKTTGIAAGTVSLPTFNILAAGESANNRLNVACVGIGGMGAAAVRAARAENLVAVCDVDIKRAGKNWNAVASERRFQDYRKMLDKLGNEIDAVCISTPDHMHAPIALAAMQMGKHVYVQKPLSRTIGEAQVMLSAAKKYGVITQMGNQGHSGEGLRLTREWVQGGIIGKVGSVDIWTDRPIWPQGGSKLPQPVAVPKTMAWDNWLGVAAKRPYSPAYAPFNWRGWLDFGAGAIGDIACHIMDPAVYSLDLDQAATVTVEAKSSGVTPYMFPNWSIITYKFASRGKNMPPVTLTWYDGKKRPPRPKDLEPKRRLSGTGMFMYGSEGTILCNGMHAPPPRVIPETKMRELRGKLPAKTIPRIRGGHFNNFFKSCKAGEAACSDFKVSVPLTSIALLGNLAMLAGHKLECNLQTMQIKGIENSDPRITPTYLTELTKTMGLG